MKTLVGLGNPGPEYEETRHNVGRVIVKGLAKRLGCPKFEESAKYFSLITKCSLGKEPAVLLLPNTFMNKSGKALLALKPRARDLVVVHDDSDLPLGTYKISFGKNSGGHKGVESIMRALKTKDFWRIRIGIQKKKRVPAIDLVLQKWKSQEKALLKKIESKVWIYIQKPLQTTTVR